MTALTQIPLLQNLDAIRRSANAIFALFLSPSGALTPSSTQGIVGTTAGDNANAGSVGEYQSASFTNVSMTGALDLASLTLTPGDWDVSGTAVFSSTGAPVLTNCAAGISTASNNFGPAGTYAQYWAPNGTPMQAVSAITPTVRINISTATTVYFYASCGTTTGVAVASGMMRARRVR